MSNWKHYIYFIKEYIKNFILKIIKEINIIKKDINDIPKKYKIIYIILFWLLLFLIGDITENRLIRFSIVLLIILIYKILHQLVKKINIKDKHISILLKIYKYKNPIIWLIIEMEEKIFNYIYNLTKKLKPFYINIIFHILYNLTGFNGIKIILYKFYQILSDWKNYTIYEIIFKRIYGMIFSVLIFTNVIEVILCILKNITINWIILIYIFLIVITYISNYNVFRLSKDLIDLEEYRMDCNLIGTILQKASIYRWSNINNIENIKRLNKDIKTHLWFLKPYNIKWLTYSNFLKYKALTAGSKYNKWMEYYNKPSFFYFNDLINQEIYINYIITKYNKLEKGVTKDLELLNYCEYNILLYKLRVFYIWDVEKWLDIKETYFKIIKENIYESYYDKELTSITYEYTLQNKNLEKVYKLYFSKFWEIKEDFIFYAKLHNYLYDINFKENQKYKKWEKLYNDDELSENVWADDYRDLKIEKQEEYLQKELNIWRAEWQANEAKALMLKYEKIFCEIEFLKQIKCTI